MVVYKYLCNISTLESTKSPEIAIVSGVWMRSTVSVMVDLSFISFFPLSVNATGLERSVIYI